MKNHVIGRLKSSDGSYQDGIEFEFKPEALSLLDEHTEGLCLIDVYDPKSENALLMETFIDMMESNRKQEIKDDVYADWYFDGLFYIFFNDNDCLKISKYQPSGEEGFSIDDLVSIV